MAQTTDEKPKLSSVQAITPEPEPEGNGSDNDITPVKKTKPVVDNTSKAPKKEKPKEEDVLDVLESRSEPVPVTLEYNGASATYLQKPLSYFRKMEFFGLVGETLDKAMEGEDGLTVNSVLGDSDSLTSSFNDLDSFMALVAKIAHYVPTFLKDAYVIILNIPKGDRAWAREALDNVDDEAGLAIAERFIDQNMESIKSFFGERIPALIEKVRGEQQD